MKFHNHVSLFETLPKHERDRGVNHFYSAAHYLAQREFTKMIRSSKDGMMQSDFRIARITAEWNWYAALRPYYKVWPSIIGSLCKIRLDVTLDSLELREESIAIRFKDGDEPEVAGVRLRSILASAGKWSGESKSYIDVSIGLLGDHQRANFMIGAVEGTLENEVNNTSCINGDPERMVSLSEFVTRIVITTFLLKRDPSIIKPDVLAADRQKFDETGDPKYIEKARKRGIVGWRIGEAYESVPHIRRPHFALRHTGPGGTIPRIVPVKGAVVHRDKLTQVPTGYITPDNTEVEP